jgi:RimJ/RimL family protein N-acetyltransferase
MTHVRSYADPHMEIRPLQVTDGPAVHRSLLSDPEIAAWFGPHGTRTRAEAEAMVKKKAAHRALYGFGWSLAWEGEECLGWGVAQHWIIDGFSEVEIGWTVARSHWRQGLGTVLAAMPSARCRAADCAASSPGPVRTTSPRAVSCPSSA